MKKALCVLAVIAMVAMVSTSCKKNCECTTETDGKVIGTVTSEIKNGKCSDLESEITIGSSTTKTTCK
ncbi:MAG: hypothetical protein LBK03_00215 [Bacteroidales bacterium]|jgi:hypothetical protein|nr:hypothetical protein [Bacteroidales bacterium]